MAEERLERRRTLQLQRISDHRARESTEQREEHLFRCSSLEQQRARNRHTTETVEEKEALLTLSRDQRTTETEAQRGKVGSLNTTCGIAPAKYVLSFCCSG